MARLLVKHIEHLVTCDDSDRVLQDVNVLAEDGVITRIFKEDPEAEGITAEDVIALYRRNREGSL